VETKQQNPAFNIEQGVTETNNYLLSVSITESRYMSKKQKAVILAMLALLIATIVFSGCITEKDRFIGTWKSTKPENSAWSINYFSNGTILSSDGITNRKGSWEVNDGKITLIMSDDQTALTYDYSFSENDETLTITPVADGFPAVYIKQ
jgi:hypothetical protein